MALKPSTPERLKLEKKMISPRGLCRAFRPVGGVGGVRTEAREAEDGRGEGGNGEDER